MGHFLWRKACLHITEEKAGCRFFQFQICRSISVEDTEIDDEEKVSEEKKDVLSSEADNEMQMVLEDENNDDEDEEYAEEDEPERSFGMRRLKAVNFQQILLEPALKFIY